MVLQHVTRRAGGVVERRAAADADVLGHGDLHRVDVVGVPDRLEQLVGEAQRHDVLDRLLAQVVVDAEDVLGGEDLVDEPLSSSALARSCPNGFSTTTRRQPPALGVAGHPGALHLLQHRREHARRDRQVERRVALDAVAGAQVVERLAERVERLVVVERAGDELDVARQSPPDLLVPGRPGVLLGRLAGQALEVAVAPVAAREAEQHEVRRQQPAVGEVVDRRQQLLAGQVAGDPEDDEGARLRDPREPPVARVAQRVVGDRRGLADRCRARGCRRRDRRRGGLDRGADGLAHDVAASSCPRTLSASCA